MASSGLNGQGRQPGMQDRAPLMSPSVDPNSIKARSLLQAKPRSLMPASRQKASSSSADAGRVKISSSRTVTSTSASVASRGYTATSTRNAANGSSRSVSRDHRTVASSYSSGMGSVGTPLVQSSRVVRDRELQEPLADPARHMRLHPDIAPDLTLDGVNMKSLQYLESINQQHSKHILDAQAKLLAEKETTAAAQDPNYLASKIRNIQTVLNEDRKQRDLIVRRLAELRHRQEKWRDGSDHGSGEWENSRDRIIEAVARSREDLRVIRERRELMETEMGRKETLLKVAKARLETDEEAESKAVNSADETNLPRMPQFLHAELNRLQLQLADPAGIEGRSETSILAEDNKHIRTHAPLMGDLKGRAEHKLFDEVLARRQIERDEEAYKHAQKMRELNDKRAELIALKEDLHKKSLAAKKDLDISLAAQRNGIDSTEPVESIVARLDASLLEQSQRLEKLREEREETLRLQLAGGEPYDGSWGPDSYSDEQLKSYWVVRPLVDDVVRETLEKLLPSVKSQAQLHKDRQDLMEAERVLQRNMQDAALEKAAIFAMQSIIDSVSTEQSADIVREVWFGEAWCQDVATSLLLEGLMQSISTEHKRSLAPHVLRNLQMEVSRRRKPKRQAHVHSYTLKSRDAVTEDDDEEDEEEAAAAALAMEEIPTLVISEDAVDKEQQYWSGIKFVPSFVVSNIPKGVSLAIPSLDGWLLAVCLVKGGIWIYDLRSMPPTLLRKSEATETGIISSLQWSFDNTSFVTLDVEGRVKVWSLRHAWGQPLITEDGTFQPPACSLVTTLPPIKAPKKGAGSGQQTEVEKAFAQVFDSTSSNSLEPRAVGFHPSFTVLGTQPSIIVGLDGGVIMKQNTPDSRFVLHGECLIPPPVSTLDADSGVQDEVVEIKRMGSIKSMKTSEMSESTSGIPSQEFFVGHKSPLILLGNYRKTTTVVSLDEQGVINVWPYEPFAFTGFGWFESSQTAQVNLVQQSFAAVQGGAKEQIFPEPAVKIPTLASGLPNFLQKSRDQAKHLDMMFSRAELDAQAWYSYTLSDDSGTVAIHKPPGRMSKGSQNPTFYVAHYDYEGELLQLEKEEYEVKEIIGRIMHAQMDDSGSIMYVLVRYAELHPKPANVTIVKIDLRTMQFLGPKVEMVLPPTIKKAALDNISFAASPTIDGTGSAYAYVLMGNLIYCVSLTTGEMVLRHPLRPLQSAGNAKANIHSISVAGPNRNIIACARDSNILFVYDIEDPVVASKTGKMVKRQASVLPAEAIVQNNEEDEEDARPDVAKISKQAVQTVPSKSIPDTQSAVSLNAKKLANREAAAFKESMARHERARFEARNDEESRNS